MWGAPPACAARPTKRAVFPNRPLLDPGTHARPSSGRGVVWIIIAGSPSSRWPRRSTQRFPPRTSSRAARTSLRRNSRSPPSSAGTAMNTPGTGRRSMALARRRPIAAPTSPAIWALWPHAWTAPVDRSASGCPATTSASSSPTSANVGPGPAPPAASARTPVIASPVRGARPSWRNFVSTSADVLSSLKPSSGWRRIASPTATISSAWRSIASSTRCLSSSRVMGSPRSSFIKFASGLGAPAPAGPAARTTTSSPLDRRVWRRISEPRAAGARQFRSTRGELNNDRGEWIMKAAAAVAEILKREGVRFLIGYPVNPIIEAAAEADIRTIIVRQERTGLHMADAVSRISSGDRIGVFAMQHGPGSENAFGGVAQAYGDSVPIVVLPGGYPRRITNIQPNFNSFLNYQHVTKWCEQVIVPDAVVDAMRRAFTQVKNGRPRPVLIEFPVDLLREDVPEPIQYTRAPRLRSSPDPRDVSRVAEGHAHRARDARPDRHQQGRGLGAGARRRRGPHAPGAARRGEGPTQGRAARPLLGRHPGDQEPQERVAGPVDAAAHRRHEAAVPV